MKRIFELIVSKLNRAARRTVKIPRTFLSVDSTTFTVGKTCLPWAVYHGDRSGIKLHVSFTNKTSMPLQVIETPGLKHDGPIGNSLEDKRFILQAVPIFRLNRKKTLKGSHTKNSNVTADFTCTLAHRKNKRKSVIVSYNLRITKAKKCAS